MSQVRVMIVDRDPRVWRLFPDAYDDPEREAEFRRMVDDELVQNRLAAIETVTETLDADTIDAAALDEWVRAVNTVRLVLGTALDVDEDGAAPDLDPDSPEGIQRALYDHLSTLLWHAVKALESAPGSTTGDG